MNSVVSMRWPLIGLTLVAVAVYIPGLNGPFVFDDIGNVVGNSELSLDRLSLTGLMDTARSSAAGPTGRPIAMLSFAVNAHFLGWEPIAFKSVNLAIHLVNGLLVFGLASSIGRKIVDSESASRDIARFAWLVSAIWLLHPIQLTSVLYVVQRMTSLAATPVLAGLLFYIITRARATNVRSLFAPFTTLIIAAGIGSLIKENAVLVLPLAALLEYFFLSRDRLTKPARRALHFGFLAVLVLPTALLVSFTLFDPSWLLAGYAYRDFGIEERLLSQSRALFFYLSLFVWPDLTRFGIFHDDIPLSTSLLSPMTSGMAVLGWVVVILLAWRLRFRAPVAAFGVGWFLIAHSVESSVVGLELVFEHRNYVPLFGPVFALVWYGQSASSRYVAGARVRVGLSLALLGALALVTVARAEVWSSSRSLAEFSVTHHPRSVRALTTAAFWSISAGRPFEETFARFERAANTGPKNVAALVELSKMVAGLMDSGLIDNNVVSNKESAWGKATLEARALSYDQRVRRQLQEYPVSAEVTHSLTSLQECLRAEMPVCTAMEERTVAWHTVALKNSRMEALSRATLQLSLAKLFVARGDINRGLALARAAADGDHSGVVEVGMQLVDLYILLGDWRAAEHRLMQLEDRNFLRQFRVAEVRAARRRITQAQAVTLQ